MFQAISDTKPSYYYPSLITGLNLPIEKPFQGEKKQNAGFHIPLGQAECSAGNRLFWMKCGRWTLCDFPLPGVVVKKKCQPSQSLSREEIKQQL